MEKPYRSLKEFYPFYLTEHHNTISRILHFTGTFLVFIILIGSVLLQHWWYLLLIPLVGYGFAWFGHFFFEKNKPATFEYPFYSLMSDFKLFIEILAGKRKFNPEKEKIPDSD